MSGQLLKGVDHNSYHLDLLPGAPHLSRSVAVKLLHQSPLHAWQAHPRLGGAPDDPLEEVDPQHQARLDTGSLIHGLLLGAGAELVEIYIHGDKKKGQSPGELYPATSYATNEAKRLRDEARAAGKLPAIPGKVAAAKEAAAQICASLRRYGLELAEYEPEATCLWESEGVACKARMDLLQLARGEILDLKVQERINLGSFERGILPLGLDIQNASYVEGVETVHAAMAGRVSLTFLLVERFPPFDVAIVPLSPALVDLGRQRWSRARKIWKSCLASGKWPGFGPVAPIEAKPWQLESEFSAALAGAEEL